MVTSRTTLTILTIHSLQDFIVSVVSRTTVTSRTHLLYFTVTSRIILTILTIHSTQDFSPSHLSMLAKTISKVASIYTTAVTAVTAFTAFTD